MGIGSSGQRMGFRILRLRSRLRSKLRLILNIQSKEIWLPKVFPKGQVGPGGQKSQPQRTQSLGLLTERTQSILVYAYILMDYYNVLIFQTPRTQRNQPRKDTKVDEKKDNKIGLSVMIYGLLSRNQQKGSNGWNAMGQRRRLVRHLMERFVRRSGCHQPSAVILSSFLDDLVYCRLACSPKTVPIKVRV